MHSGRVFALERWRDIVIPEKGWSTRQGYCKWDAGPKNHALILLYCLLGWLYKLLSKRITIAIMV